MTTTLAPPTHVTVQVGISTVFLEWQYNDTTDIDEFRIYRQDGEEESFIPIGVTSDLFFTDSLLINGKEYFYEIAAVSKRGFESAHTEPVLAVPSMYSILIQDGIIATSQRFVTLRLLAPETTTFMMISNDSL